MQMKINRLTRWILLILWMWFIFMMSSMPGEVSSEQSGIVVELIGKLGIDINGHVGELLSFLVRKLAHLAEYMILFLLIYNVFLIYIDNKRARLLSILVLFIYACSDEIHQCFVPGREGAFRDVIIDTSGGGIVLGFLIIKDKFFKATIK